MLSQSNQTEGKKLDRSVDKCYRNIVQDIQTIPYVVRRRANMSILMEIIRRRGIYNQSRRFTMSIVASLAISLFVLPASAKYEGGAGTADDPYLINTAEQMNEIGANPGDWDKHFMLTADVNMSDIAGTDYNIIETFNGVFDGNNCTISNFSLTSTRQENTGLFGFVSGRVENLVLLRPNIFAQGNSVGSLTGHLNQGSIINCYAKGAVVSGGLYVGGLVGSNTGYVNKCCTTGSVWGDAYVGGLVGQVGDGKVTMCYSRAGVSGNRNVGGLVGKTSDEASEVTLSYAIGAVEGDAYVGGLVGQVERGNAYKCYSTGSVSGNQYVGGFVGHIRVLGNVTHSFWDTQTSSQTTSAGGTGKTTAQMQMISTFTSTGWDFWNIWTMCEGMNYPVLIWQIPVADFLCPDGVDFIDFSFFAARWGQNHCNAANRYCDGTDLNQSGSVDFPDLEILAKLWLEGFD